MKRRLENKPYFIILIGVFYLFSVIDTYYPVLKISDLNLPAPIWIIVIHILLYIVIRFILPKFTKYSLLLLYLDTIYLFYGSLQFFLKENISFLSHYRYLLPLLLCIAILIYFIIKRSTTSFSRLFLYLNTVLSIFVLMEIGKVAIKHSPNNVGLSVFQKKDPVISAAICDTCLKPDIYFIIFDGYSASRTLKDYWNYNNNSLDSFFRQHGFYYSWNSRSNYNFTPYSVGSILNMDYHSSKPDQVNLRQFCKGIATMKPNRVCEILQKNNYAIINQSYFPLPNEKPALDISYAANKKRVFISQTLWAKVQADIGWNFPWLKPSVPIKDFIALGKIQQTQIRKAYDILLKASARKNQQPVFVYTHFLIPHEPYLYDSTGNATPDTTWFYTKKGKEGYLSQLKYTNTIIKDVVTHLKNEGDRPRVIIIQSDHGYRFFDNKELQHLEFNNLNAIYFPDKEYSQLYDSITSINTFPVIFNKYFHASIPLLKDSSIYIRH